MKPDAKIFIKLSLRIIHLVQFPYVHRKKKVLNATSPTESQQVCTDIHLLYPRSNVDELGSF